MFHQDSVLLHTDTAPPYTYTWSDVPVGSYALRTTAHDDEGTSVTSGEVHVSVTAGAPATTDPGLVWIFDRMDTHDGRLVEGWSPWSSGQGSAEWSVVPGEGGWWAQGVDVQLDFTASSWTTTLLLRADLTGLADVGVAFDNVSVERLLVERLAAGSKRL